MPFVTPNADEGAGGSRWRHPLNLVGTTPEPGDSRVNNSDAASILRPEKTNESILCFTARGKIEGSGLFVEDITRMMTT